MLHEAPGNERSTPGFLRIAESCRTSFQIGGKLTDNVGQQLARTPAGRGMADSITAALVEVAKPSVKRRGGHVEAPGDICGLGASLQKSDRL